MESINQKAESRRLKAKLEKRRQKVEDNTQRSKDKVLMANGRRQKPKAEC